jgi:hypothetical protein
MVVFFVLIRAPILSGQTQQILRTTKGLMRLIGVILVVVIRTVIGEILVVAIRAVIGDIGITASRAEDMVVEDRMAERLNPSNGHHTPMMMEPVRG